MRENGSRSPSHLLLVLLPGLAVSLLTVARFRVGVPLRALEALPLLLCALLVVAALARYRRHGSWAIWCLPASGYLLAAGIPLLGGLFPTGTGGEIFSYLWLLVTIGAATILLWQQQRSRPLPLALWLLPGVALLAQPWVIIFGGLLFLPSALALRLAREHGGRATVLVAPALYWLADALLEPAYGIRIWQGGEQAALLLTLLPPVLFMLFLPAGLLLSRSRQQQLVIIVAIPLCLLAAELWRSSFFAGTARGGYDVRLWLVRAGAILQYTLLPLWLLLGGWYLSKERALPRKQQAIVIR